MKDKVTVNILKFHTPKFPTKWHVQRSSLIRVYSVSDSTKYFKKKKLYKKQNLGKKTIEKSVGNFKLFTECVIW